MPNFPVKTVSIYTPRKSILALLNLCGQPLVMPSTETKPVMSLSVCMLINFIIALSTVPTLRGGTLIYKPYGDVPL